MAVVGHYRINGRPHDRQLSVWLARGRSAPMKNTDLLVVAILIIGLWIAGAILISSHHGFGMLLLGFGALVLLGRL
jgi:hypothetical protein